ncbi:hypothetical protein DEJ50_05575 [Streptomyces venezuelae]|uniref:Uncharacterized protein n=1 Tax=Streptomyces venezuelae TaxID=54571 RepID=A0A5P2D1Z1_STRVZ|nr:hypothetical protein [Streptomyces venezuelae]QES47371.1 hypothetical protein DEJ50_05575 [Streptomyces venezuelae]
MGPQITNILIEAGTPLLLAAAPVAGVVKAWIDYRRAVVVERWRTAQLRTALRGPVLGNGAEGHHCMCGHGEGSHRA